MTNVRTIPVIPITALIPKRNDSAQVLADIISIVQMVQPAKWAAADEAQMVYLNAYADLFGSMAEDNNL